MTVPAISTGQERTLIDLACGGDEAAFGRLVEPYRGQLHAHCYRMLGSVHDAEDTLQDALLRAWRSLDRLERRASLRAWLYRIATNACLDTIARRPRRVLPVDCGPPVDPAGGPGEPLGVDTWVEPYPDERFGVPDGHATPEARYEQREALELAFVAALQHLPARQRAVLVLREVLGFSAREVAAMLDTTVAAVNSALQRARRTVDERLPDRSQQATLRALGDGSVRELVGRFVDAFEEGDVTAILATLAEDATFEMPPYPSWCRGREAVVRSWLLPDDPSIRLRFLPTRASGQVALAAYRWNDARNRYLPIALDVLTLRGTEIAGVTAFRTPGILRAFGLPEELDP